VRYNWTIEALECVYAQGLTPVEVQSALAGREPRLIQPVNGETRRVLARTSSGRLIEVWLRDSPNDEELDVWVAFDAGLLGEATWKNAFGDGGS
jgi:hypothetical protein